MFYFGGQKKEENGRAPIDTPTKRTGDYCFDSESFSSMAVVSNKTSFSSYAGGTTTATAGTADVDVDVDACVVVEDEDEGAAWGGGGGVPDEEAVGPRNVF